ncbi:MAG: hypothetical protein ABIJ04_08785 [Bacteroidota bacterium]
MKTIVLFVFLLTYAMQIIAQPRYPHHIDEHRRKVSVEYAMKNELPLCFVDVIVDYDTAGTPLLKLFSQNVTTKVIKTYTIEVYCYDRNNAPVHHRSKKTNVYVGNSEYLTPSLSDVYFPDIWVLDGYDNTSKVKVYLIMVHFWDGTDWIPKDKKVTLIQSAGFH